LELFFSWLCAQYVNDRCAVEVISLLVDALVGIGVVAVGPRWLLFAALLVA